MNLNIYNNSNGNNDSKNVPFKAYLLNKYEHLKQPATVDSQGNFSHEPSHLPLSSSASSMYKFQQQKSAYPQLSNDLADFSPGMYAVKPSTSSNSSHNLKLSTKPSTPRVNNYDGSNSSLVNSDDEDDYNDTGNNSSLFDADRSREEKRRISHTAAEQKRRNAIKRGYDDLQSIVPSCEYMDPSSSQKVCKATVLKRSIDYIHEMEKEKDNHEAELDSLKKEIMALKIMKSNYEEILQFHRNQPKDNSVEINNDAVFDLFVSFSDKLFQTFSTMISGNSFAEMTSSTLNWLEHVCTAKNLKNMVVLSLYNALK